MSIFLYLSLNSMPSLSHDASFLIHCRSLPEDLLPVSLPQEMDVPLKPKKTKEYPQKRDAETAGLNGVSNGVNGATAKRKRHADDAELDQATASKRGKMQGMPSKTDDIVVLDDSDNGAIMIDD